MKKLAFVLSCVLQLVSTGYAQENPSKGQSYSLGTVQQFLNKIQQRGGAMTLAVADGTNLNVNVNYQNKKTNETHIQGAIAGAQGGSFNIDIVDGKLQGLVLMPKSYQAYEYYTDASGNAFVKQADIRKLTCVDFLKDEHDEAEGAAQRPTTDPDVSNLQSYPGAVGCMLLDFDGYEMPAGNYWNNGNAISAATAGMTNEEILKAWEIVAEDYFPFNLNVTTNEAVFNTYPMNKRIRCVVTPTNYFFPGCAGISFTGSFLFNNNAPCWVFTSGTGLTGKRVGEASAHELGHAMGLSHDGVTGADYYGGHGNWAPIMGNSMSKPVSQFSKGEYNGATNQEDDIAIIANMSTNGVGYRADDHSNLVTGATQLVNAGGTLIAGQNKGFIGRMDDLDQFTFTSTGGNTALIVKAVSEFTDVRLSVTLKNAAGTVINSYIAPASDLDAPIAINESLPVGDYYLVINGDAAGTASADYDDYSSLGTYEIMGGFNVTPLSVELSPLSAKIVDHNTTMLNWKTYTEQSNRGFRIERSADAKTFTEVGFVASQHADGNSNEVLSYQFNDEKSLSGTSYYRIAQVDMDGKASFSNVVSVSRENASDLAISIYPNPAQSQLAVEVKGAMKAGSRITMTDVAGRVVLSEAVNTQKTDINMSAFRSGMYLIKYTDGENSLVQKVLKN